MENVVYHGVDTGIDRIVQVNFERRAKYLQGKLGPDISVSKEMVAKAFQEALERQATKRDGNFRVTEISLDGAENEKLAINRITDDFLEVLGFGEFRIDTKSIITQPEDDDARTIKELKFVFRSVSAPKYPR